MKRIIGHWTGGGGRASAKDLQHYHRLVEYDGTIVAGKEEIEDNIVTSDGDYAAHTRNLNTDSIGIAMCGMHGAIEHPFQPGDSPLTEKQFNAFCILISDLCRQYSIPVTRETVLTHAEVEPTLGVKQRGKWDIVRLPFKPGLVGALAVGDYMRDRVRQILGEEGLRFEHRPILKMGGTNPRSAVTELQQDLKNAGYHLGRVDGMFGRRTRAAVLAFQADNGLLADGVVGPQTWAAFETAEGMPEREIDEAELKKTSRTVKMADRGEKTLTSVEGIMGTGVSVGAAVEVAKSAQQAEGALEIAQRMLSEYWPTILVVVAIFIAVRYGKHLLRSIKRFRLEDARSNRHLG
jgi:hypothetical protein